MANSRELKANLRRDNNALELAALYVRALYLLNMSDRDVDSDSRYNFGATKDLLISVMGANVVDDYNYGFYDRDMFNSECTAKDINDFYSDIIDIEETKEKESTMNHAMQNHDNVSVALMADEISRAYDAMVSGDVSKAATLVRLAAEFEKDFFVEKDGVTIKRLDISKRKQG